MTAMLGGYRIGEVAKLLGMSTHALRAWERRHKIVSPDRSLHGERLYTPPEVERLSVVKQLSDFGHPLTDIARLSTPELHALLERTRALSAGSI
jgi:MerR family transcriptional regulator, light-induced transcriptional regulator